MSFPFKKNKMREKRFGEGTRKLVGERMWVGTRQWQSQRWKMQRTAGLGSLANKCVCMLSYVRLFATPWTVAPPGSSVHGIFLGGNTGVGCLFFLQRVFLTQGLNTHLLGLLKTSAGGFFEWGCLKSITHKHSFYLHRLIFAFFFKIYSLFGISLVGQWLRIYLTMKRTWVRSLVWELRSHMPRSS